MNQLFLKQPWVILFEVFPVVPFHQHKLFQVTSQNGSVMFSSENHKALKSPSEICLNEILMSVSGERGLKCSSVWFKRMKHFCRKHINIFVAKLFVWQNFILCVVNSYFIVINLYVVIMWPSFCLLKLTIHHPHWFHV